MIENAASPNLFDLRIISLFFSPRTLIKYLTGYDYSTKPSLESADLGEVTIRERPLEILRKKQIH